MVHNITGAPVCGADLFGREYEMNDLWRRLERGEHILMVAPRRVGKSSLMQELRRAPRPGFTVFYSDLEKGRDAGDLFSELLAQLACHPATRTLVDAAAGKVPFRSQFADFFKRLEVEQVDVGVARVELKSAMADGWEDTAERLKARLAALPADRHLVFILDELPILIATIIREQGAQEAIDLLGWLRSIRQDGVLSGKVCFVVGGSIGLHAVLRRHNMSGPINDFSQMVVAPWEPETAADFLRQLGQDEEFILEPSHITEMLSLLGEPIPYHLQLLFQAARDLCRDDIRKLDAGLIHRAFRDRLAGPRGGPDLDHYAQRLEVLLDADHHTVAQRVLDACCASRDGVTQTDLAGRFADDPAFNPVLRLLLEDGYLRKENAKLAFRSNLLREFWSTNYRTGI